MPTAAGVMERPGSRVIATKIVRPGSMRMPMDGFAPQHDGPMSMRRETNKFAARWRNELMLVKGNIINDTVTEVIGRVVRVPDGRMLGPNQFIDEAVGGIRVIVERVPPADALQARVDINSRAW